LRGIFSLLDLGYTAEHLRQNLPRIFLRQILVQEGPFLRGIFSLLDLGYTAEHLRQIDPGFFSGRFVIKGREKPFLPLSLELFFEILGMCVLSFFYCNFCEFVL